MRHVFAGNCPRGGSVSRIRKLSFVLTFIALANVNVWGAQLPLGEYQAKARFLANAPSFVEWPASAFQTNGAPLQICVHGDFPFGTSLAEFTRGSLVRGRRLEVKWTHADNELLSCQVVFLTRSPAKRYTKVLQMVKDNGSLTVGEDADFLKSGGMVSLVSLERGVVFDVNLDAVLDARLKISSQLLSLARHVFRGSESAGAG